MAIAALRVKENAAAQAVEKLNAKRAELAAVLTLNEKLPMWQANCTRIVAVADSEKASQESLELLRIEARDHSSQAAVFAEEEARLARQISEVDQGHSELKALLSQLQGHVQSGTCPLCGEDHGSKEMLIRRIQSHVTVDRASSARVELSKLKEKARQFFERLAENKQKQKTIEENLASLAEERTKLAGEIESFESSAANVGVVMATSGPTAVEQLKVRHDGLQREIDSLSLLAQETGSAPQDARILSTDTRSLIAAQTTTIIDTKAALARLQEEISILRSDERLTELLLDIDPAKLAEVQQANSQYIADLSAEVMKGQTEASQAKTQESVLRQEVTSVKEQLQSLRMQLVKLQGRLTEITGRLKESNLPPDTTEDVLSRIITEHARTQAQLLALRDSASNLELAIDAATTAAALTRLRENIRNKEKAVANAVKKRDQHEPWLKYFEQLVRLVHSQQNTAIANFAKDYGPRTSIIQRRLRAVYGFDEVEIRSRESAITVRVKRYGEELRPTDYFSQSQQQTLLLGLFLTACSSQNWSAFSPIFLDDPVTHFDDLNTYAFLDLIVGLLESGIGKRQFIISTCDEKLLQLAQQKFRHLEGRAKFYRFSEIGAEGPVVAEIPSWQGG